MLVKLVGRPKGWYIERSKGPHSNRKTEQYDGAHELTDLKEGQTAFERVLYIYKYIYIYLRLCLAETGESILKLRESPN